MATMYFGADPSQPSASRRVHWTATTAATCRSTIQAVIEFPNRVNLVFDITLGNSYDSDYEVYYGTDSALVVRGNQAWMLQEVDAPAAWLEVYAARTPSTRKPASS